jgi:CheY-like chemotaxis protein
MTSGPQPSADPGFPGVVRHSAQDILAELAGLTQVLRAIPQDQLGAGARPQLTLALRHTAALERMARDMLRLVAGEEPASPAQAPVPASAGLLAGRRVLVAEDSDAALRFLGALLSGAGAEVLVARSGAEALDLLARESLDLFITASVLPGMPGAQAIRALRARPDALAATPALAMTADISAQRHDELIAAGASRVVVKPLPASDEMLRIVARLIYARPDVAAAPSRDAEPALFDPGPLTRVCRLAGPDIAREILDRLILDLVETLARLDRLGAALQTGGERPAELDELRATTRVLIALAGTAGALLLHRQVQALDLWLQDDSRPVILPDLGPLLAEIRLLTRGAAAAIARLPLPDIGPGPASDQAP